MSVYRNYLYGLFENIVLGIIFWSFLVKEFGKLYFGKIVEGFVGYNKLLLVIYFFYGFYFYLDSDGDVSICVIRIWNE